MSWELLTLGLVLTGGMLVAIILLARSKGGLEGENKGLKLAARKAKAAGAVAGRAWASGRALVRRKLQDDPDRDT